MQCPSCNKDISEFSKRCYHCNKWIYLPRYDSGLYDTHLSEKYRPFHFNNNFFNLFGFFTEPDNHPFKITISFSLIILILAILTTISYCNKETDSRIYFHNKTSMDHSKAFSSDRSSVTIALKRVKVELILFSLPLIPMLILHKRFVLQILTVINSFIILLASIIINEKFGENECEQCINFALFSIFDISVLIIITVLILIIILIKSVYRTFT